MHAYIHTYILIYLHTYIHTYIHTLHYIPFHSITLHYTHTYIHYIHYITLHNITSHYITSHYITLHYIMYIHTYIGQKWRIYRTYCQEEGYLTHEQKKHIYIYTLYTHVFSAKAIETCDSKWICCNPFWYSGTGW